MRMRWNGSSPSPLISQHRSKTGNAENVIIQMCQSWRCHKVVRSRNTTAHSEPQLRTGMFHPAVQSDIYWYHQVQGFTVKQVSSFHLNIGREVNVQRHAGNWKASHSWKKTCGPRALIKSLPSKKESFRTGETERNGDNITLGFLLVLEREHTFLIQIIELATLWSDQT